MEDVQATWTDQDHADAARLLREFDARKGAGALSPDRIEAGGENSWSTRGSLETPTAHPQSSETIASQLTMRCCRNARWNEMGSRSPRPDGGLSSCLRPVAQARASNDNEPGHADAPYGLGSPL